MKYQLWLALLLFPVLFMASATAADPGTLIAGDLLARLINSVPVILLVLGAVAWFTAKTLIAVITFLQPERVRMQALWTRQDELDRQLRDSERQTGYLLLLVRELENALEACANECPSCKGFVEKAVATAREKAKARGLLREDVTMPQAANRGA